MNDILDAEHRTGQIKLHGPADFEGMRKAGRLAAEAGTASAASAPVGVSGSTVELGATTTNGSP